MKTKLVKIVVISSLLMTTLYAEKAKFIFEIDEEGEKTPDTFYPLKWSSLSDSNSTEWWTNYYSGVGYNSEIRYSTDTLDNMEASKYSSTIATRKYKLNIATYEGEFENLSFQIGGELEFIQIDKHQFGYFSSALINAGDYNAIEHNINIEAWKPNLVTQISYVAPESDFYLRFMAIVSPTMNLKLQQDTTIMPLIDVTAHSDSSTTQEASYEFEAEAIYKIKNKRLAIIPDFFSFEVNYDFLPLEYKLMTLNSSATEYMTENIQTEETNLRYMVKFAYDLKIKDIAKQFTNKFSDKDFMDTMLPTLGIGSKTNTMKNVTKGTKEEITQTIVHLGFEKKF